MIEKIGKIINKNWIEFLKEHWMFLEAEINRLDDYEEDEELPSLYIEIDKNDYYITYGGIMYPCYYSNSSDWVVPIMVNNQTTLDELKEIDLAEDSYYWDDLNV